MYSHCSKMLSHAVLAFFPSWSECLKQLCSPPRLKSLTTDSSVIVAALEKSDSGLLEINEDKTKIRRAADKPLPELNDEYKDAVKHKSVYIVSLWIDLHEFIINSQSHSLLFSNFRCWCLLLLCRVSVMFFIFKHLERFSSWNLPRWDSGVVECKRRHRKYSNEEKPAEAVQGNIFIFITQVCFSVFLEIFYYVCLCRDQCSSVLTQKSHPSSSLNVQT